MANILMVSASGRGASLAELLQQAGHDVIAAGGLPEAKSLLAVHHDTDLLIAEIQLGAFNGLQLAIRHQISHPMMRSMVLSRAHDPVLSADAKACGAAYLAEPFGQEQFLERVAAVLQESPHRRWPRKQPAAALLARIAETPARVLDLSYGGLRLETAGASDLSASFEIVFGDAGVTIQAKPIWSQPGPAGSWLHGADVSHLAHSARQAWQRLVDSVPAAAA
jgi:DNA-binding response OmpR family regulator